MADFYGTTHTGTALDASASPPYDTPKSALAGGKLRRIREVFTMAGQAAASRLIIGKLPIGAVFAGGRITASVTAGATATIAIGIEGATGKYRTAATFEVANVPTAFGNAAAMDDDPLTEDTLVFATIAAASLAGAGTLIFEIDYTTPA